MIHRALFVLLFFFSLCTSSCRSRTGGVVYDVWVENQASMPITFIPGENDESSVLHKNQFAIQPGMSLKVLSQATLFQESTFKRVSEEHCNLLLANSKVVCATLNSALGDLCEKAKFIHTDIQQGEFRLIYTDEDFDLD